MATIRPRPTATSQAATTITMRAKIWPVQVAVRARERDQREVGGVEHQLEAEQDHERVAAHEDAAAPMQKTIAETSRYQVMLIARRPRPRAVAGSGPIPVPRSPVRIRSPTLTRAGRLEPRAPAGEDHGADGGDQQQQRGDLEREQELGQEQLADLGGRAEAREEAGALLVEQLRPVPSTAMQSSTSSAPANSSERQRSPGARGADGDLVRRPRRRDEDVEHHHRAGVDDDLGAATNSARSSRNSAARHSRWQTSASTE